MLRLLALLLLLPSPGESSRNTGTVPILPKVGLCCENCSAIEYEPFANTSSWAYRYSLFVDDPSAAQVGTHCTRQMYSPCSATREKNQKKSRPHTVARVLLQ